MGIGVRLIMATTQPDLIRAVKISIERKPYIESIITVTRPTDAENKLVRGGVNVLVWDMDSQRPDVRWAALLQKRFTLHVVYTSYSSSQSVTVLKSGQDEFLQKPTMFTVATIPRYAVSFERIVSKIAKQQRPPTMRDLVKMVGVNNKQKIVVIASSTGGTNALEDIIKQLPLEIPPILIVQHMPSGFTKLFAERLDAIYGHDIKEAQSGDFLMQGKILLAPADRHMRLVRKQDKLAVECFVGDRIHGVMPAADVLFESVAEVVKSQAIGVILTGMGSDGARGLLQMRNAGCKNIGQNEASCVVYGMPKAAYDIGAIDYVLPLKQIADGIMRLSTGMGLLNSESHEQADII